MKVSKQQHRTLHPEHYYTFDGFGFLSNKNTKTGYYNVNINPSTGHPMADINDILGLVAGNSLKVYSENSSFIPKHNQVRTMARCVSVLRVNEAAMLKRICEDRTLVLVVSYMDVTGRTKKFSVSPRVVKNSECLVCDMSPKDIDGNVIEVEFEEYMHQFIPEVKHAC